MNNSTKRNCKIERTMMTQRNREAKKIKVNLNYLRKDLDIWHHQVVSWLDAKSQPQQHEIEKFGIEDVQKLCIIKRDCHKLKYDSDEEEENGYNMHEKIDACLYCERKEHYMDRYKAERNELKVDRQRLEKLLANQTEERNDLAQKLKKIELDNAKLEDKNKKLESHFRNTGNKVHEVEEMMQKLEETAQEQEQENRDLIVKLENLNKEKKDLEDRLRVIGSHYKEELGQKKEEIDKIQRDKEKYMVSKDEMSSFKKDNAELKQKLKNLSTQLNESENRLEINNYEKSSLIKKIKELKNILQEKLSEIQRLETRLQKYAEQFEDIQVQKRHMDNLQSDNDELNQKCTNLQTVKKNVQKLKKEKQQLETEMISQRRKNETLNSRVKILYDEKLDNEDKLRRYITTDQKAKNDIKQLQTAIQDLKEENWEYIFQGNKFREEKTELENKLRLHDNEVRLLYNSLDTERHEHDAAMKRLEMQYTAVQNECVELWLKLQNIHNSSEISFEKLGSVIDKNIFKQKLEETTAHENTLAKETTKIMKNFASAKDKKGCIKVLLNRFEKDLPSCDNDISSDEKTTDMEDNNSNSSCKKYYEETLTESRATTICHNRMNRTTNVFNVNIASSKVSFNENTEEQCPCLAGSNGQYPAIDEGQ